MLFNSFIFPVFLAVVLGIYFLCPAKKWKGLKVFLLTSSYVFYAWWDYRFVSLLLISTIVDFCCVSKLQQEKKKVWLYLSLIVNLGILGFFKYANFFIDSASALLASFGFGTENFHLDVVLPVGISFYTFQTMSLSIDAYRGKLEGKWGLLDIALYVAFFPQLVAGPIVRGGFFLKQIVTKPKFRSARFQWGMWLILLGFFKKVVIADNMAVLVDRYMDLQWYLTAHALESWKIAVAFSIQIYCDFSGYTDIAIGIACLLGLRFPVNFAAPYVAISFSDFWRRWHISLSTWLRDYLYIPLGGNRKGEARTNVNLMATMLLGGLWHGASWNFVFWGGCHGFMLMIEKWIWGKGEGLHAIPRSILTHVLRCMLIFILVTLIWVPFRCTDFSHTWAMYVSMFTRFEGMSLVAFLGDLPMMLVAIGIFFVQFLRSRRILPRRSHYAWRLLAASLMIYALMNYQGQGKAFLYFQF